MKFSLAGALLGLATLTTAITLPTRSPLELDNFQFPDSNITKRDLDKRAVTTVAVSCNNKGPSLGPGGRLNPSDCLTSNSGSLKFVLQGDGNIVLYLLLSDKYTGVPLWSSGTWGHGGGFLSMQPDGNLVAYDPKGPYWSTNNAVKGGMSRTLLLQDDWNAVVYQASGAVWSTNTVGHDVTTFEGHSRAFYGGILSVRTMNDYTAALWTYLNYYDPSSYVSNKQNVDMTSYQPVTQLTGTYAAKTSQYVGYGMPFRFLLAGYACDTTVTCGVGLPKLSGWYRYNPAANQKVSVTLSGQILSEVITVTNA